MAFTDPDGLFPVSTKIDASSRMTVCDCDLISLAETHGTPLYIYDSLTIKQNVTLLADLLSRYYPGASAAAYASKAYFSQRFARKIAEMPLELDVVSLSELKIALKSGIHPDRIHLHGNNKSEEELRLAIETGIHAIVVDNFGELQDIKKISAEMDIKTPVWLRITPDIRVQTHPHIETAAKESKFGFHVENGDAEVAIRYALQAGQLDLIGLHFHLGSQLFDAEPYRIALEKLFEMSSKCKFIPKEISPGGGWGVRYTAEDPAIDPANWIRTISATIKQQCEQRSWILPKLIVEPGRWLVARAGLAIYSIGYQKKTLSDLSILSVDGGISDNPRNALYQAKYTALNLNKLTQEPKVPYRIVGKFCESGDVLIDKVLLPAAAYGDCLAIPVSGAYQLSMASNYNLANRPAVLWLEPEGITEILQEREIPDMDSWWI